MDISSVTRTGTINQAATVNVNAKTRPSSVPPPADGSAATVRVSKPAEMMAKLQQLQEQDPTQFKQVMSDIADKLRTSAQQSGDSNTFMSKLADKFDQAAQSGDLSALKPSGSPPKNEPPSGVHGQYHHGGAHGHGGSLDTLMSSIADEVNQALGNGAD